MALLVLVIWGGVPAARGRWRRPLAHVVAGIGADGAVNILHVGKEVQDVRSVNSRSALGALRNRVKTNN